MLAKVMEENFKEKSERQDYTSGDTFFSCHVERAANLISGKGIIPVITALRNWGCFLKHNV